MRDGVAETACNWLCGFIGFEAVLGGERRCESSARAAIPLGLRVPIVALGAEMQDFPDIPAFLLGYVRRSSDSALVAQICAINRTPNARAAFYWIQRALHFDFAIPAVNRIQSVAVPTLIVSTLLQCAAGDRSRGPNAKGGRTI